MEILLGVVVLCFSLGFLLEKATDFVGKLKSSGSAKLSKGFKAELSVVPIDKKIEACGCHANSNNELD